MKIYVLACIVLLINILAVIYVVHLIDLYFSPPQHVHFVYIDEPCGDADIEDLVKQKVILTYKPV
jgi:hypothetical protein